MDRQLLEQANAVVADYHMKQLAYHFRELRRLATELGDTELTQDIDHVLFFLPVQL